MKSYTDLEQSKKLAEILPLESADMYYSLESVNSAGYYHRLNIASEGYFDDGELGSDIPCWSLTALLGVLPTIDDEFEPQLHRSLDKYRCTYEGEEDSSGLWRVADNPVDACYEMILKLHELNLL